MAVSRRGTKYNPFVVGETVKEKGVFPRGAGSIVEVGTSSVVMTYRVAFDDPWALGEIWLMSRYLDSIDGRYV